MIRRGHQTWHFVKLREPLDSEAALDLLKMALRDYDIILHLGLPKTGTTALQQHLFPGLDSVEYLGVQQPRNRVQHELFLLLRAYVIFGKGDLDVVRKALNEAVGKGQPLLFSEEEVLIGQLDGSEQHTAMGTSWKTKLKRLKNAVSGFKTGAVVTLRDFRQGVFSYYSELIPSIGPNRNPVTLVQESDLFGIWRFPELEQELAAHFGLENVMWSHFPECVSPEGIRQIWEVERPEGLPRTNAKAKDKDRTIHLENTGLLREAAKRVPWLPLKKALRRLHHEGLDIRWKQPHHVEPWSPKMWAQLSHIEEDAREVMSRHAMRTEPS